MCACKVNKISLWLSCGWIIIIRGFEMINSFFLKLKSWTLGIHLSVQPQDLNSPHIDIVYFSSLKKPLCFMNPLNIDILLHANNIHDSPRHLTFS